MQAEDLSQPFDVAFVGWMEPGQTFVDMWPDAPSVLLQPLIRAKASAA